VTVPRVFYAANVRVWLDELARQVGRPVGLGELPEEWLEGFRRLGIDLFWAIGVWPTGSRSVEVARTHSGLAADYRRVLPDFAPEDVTGSPYAIAAYEADRRLGGRAGLAVLRRRLNAKGIGLVLDFVVNHTGLDHPWLSERPELYVQGIDRDRRPRPTCSSKWRPRPGARSWPTAAIPTSRAGPIRRSLTSSTQRRVRR
jgi:glycosidase